MKTNLLSRGIIGLAVASSSFSFEQNNFNYAKPVCLPTKETAHKAPHNLTVKRFRLAYCLAALVALLGGGVIYAFFRDIDNMVLFRHFPRPSLPPMPQAWLGTDTVWGYLFVFNLPHGLWCLSGLLVIRAVWLTNPKWRAIYAGLFLSAASLAEIMQLTGTLPGTFDPRDLASYGVSAFLESMTYNKITRRSVL